MNVLDYDKKGENPMSISVRALALVLGDQDNVATAIDDIPEAGNTR